MSGLDATKQKAMEWGRSQAEVEVLHFPLPWSKDHLVAMSERVVDHWAAELLSIFNEGDEAMKDAVFAVCHQARLGFVERIAELSSASQPEARA